VRTKRRKILTSSPSPSFYFYYLSLILADDCREKERGARRREKKSIDKRTDGKYWTRSNIGKRGSTKVSAPTAPKLIHKQSSPSEKNSSDFSLHTEFIQLGQLGTLQYYDESSVSPMGPLLPFLPSLCLSGRWIGSD